MKKLDLTSQVFERLTALCVDPTSRTRENPHTGWICECSCGNYKVADASSLRTGRIKSCGCLRREILTRKGPKHHNWKGGKFQSSAGYIFLNIDRVPIQEHRLVMEQKLGRKLTPDELVHHKNGVKSDNSPDNLELWSKSHPHGQRVEDLVQWAKQILEKYPTI